MQLEHFIVPSLLYSVFPQLFVREQFTQGIFLRPKAQQLFLNYLKRSNTTDSNNREPYHCYEPVEGGENRT